MTQDAEKVRLAKTWNANESGLLWEGLWYRQGDRYLSVTFAPGVYSPPTVYADEAAFWAAFEAERSRFGGTRIDGPACASVPSVLDPGERLGQSGDKNEGDGSPED